MEKQEGYDYWSTNGPNSNPNAVGQAQPPQVQPSQPQPTQTQPPQPQPTQAQHASPPTVSPTQPTTPNSADPNAARKIKRPIPVEEKDSKYWEKRKRNNEAARKSREQKRMLESGMRQRVLAIEEENTVLRKELRDIKLSLGLPPDKSFYELEPLAGSAFLHQPQAAHQPHVDTHSDQMPVKKRGVRKTKDEKDENYYGGYYNPTTAYPAGLWPASTENHVNLPLLPLGNSSTQADIPPPQTSNNSGWSPMNYTPRTSDNNTYGYPRADVIYPSSSAEPAETGNGVGGQYAASEKPLSPQMFISDHRQDLTLQLQQASNSNGSTNEEDMERMRMRRHIEKAQSRQDLLKWIVDSAERISTGQCSPVREYHEEPPRIIDEQE